MQMHLRTVAVLAVIGVDGLAVWRVSKAAAGVAGVAGQAASAVGNAAWAITPWNNDNVIYGAVNNTLFPDGKDTLGTWLYGVMNPEPTGWPKPAWPVLSGPGQRNNNPSAYTAPDTITPDYSGAGVWG